MIKNIFIAFENRINNLAWMSPETKVSAVEKLHMSKIKIGYPDKWKDYSALVIKSPEGGTYFENTKNMAKWRYEEDLADLNKPVENKMGNVSTNSECVL
jgi:endothelin-converting enzyme/putative endopeptidase